MYLEIYAIISLFILLVLLRVVPDNIKKLNLLELYITILFLPVLVCISVFKYVFNISLDAQDKIVAKIKELLFKKLF